jgi:subtilisin family serine protease
MRKNQLLPIAAAIGFVASGSAFAAATHAAKVPSPITKAQATKGMPTYLMVELNQPATMATYGATLRANPTAKLSAIKPTAAAAAVSQLATVKSQQATVSAAIAQARLPVAGLKEIYRLQRVFNGILYQTDAKNAAALRAIPGVKSVNVVYPKTTSNGHTVPFIGVPALWNFPGSPIHGENIKVGVIDTGIDYTHSNFGGPGTIAAYRNDDPNIIEPGTFPTVKVVGGTDLAGADYDASNASFSTPTPDPDPIDHNGHGSHVAGTIAGYGVNNDGTTYAGPYDSTLDTTTLRIGPGAAPKASLYALKVFGDNGGSTNLDALALEMAVDPNGDGNPADHLDVVNLSLGSPYGSSLNTDAVIFQNAVQAGVVVVVAAGNSSDFYFTTGSPASTPEVISVAATSVGDSSALRVNSPAAVAGLKAMGAGSPDPAVITPITANLANPVQANGKTDGCTPITNDMTGQIALIVRGTCTFAAKVDAAQAANALAVIIYNQAANASQPPANMALDSTVIIPARSLTFADGNAIAAQLTGGQTVSVTLDDSLVVVDPTQFDEVASFTARGPAQLLNKPLLKPDIAAPGLNIISTGAGTGSGSANDSGTSMATPLTAGVMALLKQLHPTWTPGQLKALAMNTANHDTFVDPTTATNRRRTGPARVGAGRIDAANALNSSSIAYDQDFPDRVSITFQTVEVAVPTTETRTIEVSNTGTADATYSVSIDPAVTSGGTSVTASTGTITVPAGQKATFQITLQADPTQMVRGVDPSVSLSPVNSVFGGGVPRDWQSETSGWVTLTPATGPKLRVPYYGALTPASASVSSGAITTHGQKTGTGQVFLQGSATDTSAIAPEPFGVLPTALPMELHYTGAGFSMLDFANIHHVGVINNATEADSFGATEYFFGVNTFGVWGAPGEITIQVNIKEPGSPVWQYALVNIEAGNAPASQTPGSDVRLTALFPLDASGNAVSGSFEDFVNGVVASSQFVPAFLTDTMVLPVFASDLNLPNGFDYQVQTFVFDNVPGNPYGGTQLDQTPVLHYNPSAPALTIAQDPAFSSISGAIGFGPPFQSDLPGNSFPVAYNQTVNEGNPQSGMLLLHLNNAFGNKAEAVSIVTAQQLTSVTTIAPGAICANGGQAINTGFDDNGNGVLDPSEIVNSQPVCNGATGPQGPQGPQGPASALIVTSVIAPGASCAAGGVQITIGLDANGDGILQPTEITSQQNICNGETGATGSAGAATLIATATIGSGSVCPTGGVTIMTGPDTNGNGTLDASEVTSTQNICNGVAGQSGAAGQQGPGGATGAPGATGPQGPAGPKGGCTSFGGGASLLTLIGLLGMYRRKRQVIA